MKRYLILILLLLWLPACHGTRAPSNAADPKDFCGQSTRGPCQSDADCKTGGCSKQICQSKSEGDAITACDYKECYDASRFGLQCSCQQGECKWN